MEWPSGPGVAMWMFVGLMSVLLASSVVDSSLRADNGTGGADSDGEGDDGSEHRPEDPWLDEWDDDEYISSDDDPLEDDEDSDGDDDGGGTPPGDDDDHDGERPPEDPWLDEWEDDEYISSDSLSLALARAEDDEALHVMGSGDRLVAGDGGVYVLGDWIDTENPVVIAGFQPGADQLIYAHEASAGAPEFTLVDASEESGPVLFADGQPVLLFEGGTAPQADAVLLFPVSLDHGAADQG